MNCHGRTVVKKEKCFLPILKNCICRSGSLTWVKQCVSCKVLPTCMLDNFTREMNTADAVIGVCIDSELQNFILSSRMYKDKAIHGGFRGCTLAHLTKYGIK
jgi:hypothetical protein